MSLKSLHSNEITRRRWAEWRAALFLGLLLAAFLAAPDAKAWDPFSPIVGSIAEDLIAIGDRQYGPTEFIVQKQDNLALKVRHQRTTLEGAEIFCTQHPLYVQQSYFGIRINRYNEDDLVTICQLAEEPTPRPTIEEIFRNGPSAQAEPEKPAPIEDWLLGAQIRTERAYCIGNFESREFAAAQEPGSWISEGNLVDYQPQMFAGFEVMADKEGQSLFVISSPLDKESARQMGCALQRAHIVVKLTVLNPNLGELAEGE